MTRQKAVDILIYTATGFTAAHGLLHVLTVTNRQLYEQISLHYSDSITWYVIFFLLPLLFGITFYLLLKDKHIAKSFRILFTSILILQLTFTLLATILNYNYWGYAFKRPPVFKEILYADKVLTCSSVSNNDSTGIKSLHSFAYTTTSLDKLHGREDIYYGKTDRPFMVFQDRAPINGYLYDFPRVYNNPNQKISKTILQSIDKQIQEANIIDKGENGWDTSGHLYGFITEFLTIDKTKYIIAELNGGEVSNDHYPFYELLFAAKDNNYKLIKKQRFYTDLAGIEGFEYANIAPFFSLLLTIVGLVVALIISVTTRIVKATKTNKGYNAL